MDKARPKSFVMYRIAAFSGEAECLVSCYPQQKWEYIIINGCKVALERKGINLTIQKEDFEKHWKVVE